MGAVTHINLKKYELQCQMFYTQGKLNLKNDTISRQGAEKYMAKLSHKNEMKHILKVVK